VWGLQEPVLAAAEGGVSNEQQARKDAMVGVESYLELATHRAQKERRCYHCGATILTGAAYRQYRERATSSFEAQHAGMYPRRHQCLKCASRAVPGLRSEK